MLAASGGAPGGWAGEVAHALVASVVSAQLCCLGGTGGALVPVRRGQGRLVDPGCICCCGVLRGKCTVADPGAVRVPDGGVLPLFLAGGTDAAGYFPGKAARSCPGRSGSHVRRGGMGMEERRNGVPLPCRPLWTGGERAAAPAGLLWRGGCAGYGDSGLGAGTAVLVFPDGGGHDGAVSAPCSHCGMAEGI